MSSASTAHVLILGGGYVGLYTAWGLRKELSPSAVKITVVEPNSYMTYQPLLPEVAGGELDAGSVAVDLARALKNVDLFRGRLTSLDVNKKSAVLESITGATVSMDYDHVVLALGAVTRTFPTPGLGENAVGFKTLEEAIYVRDQVLENVALAAAATDPADRSRALTFVFVGAGYTGVEALSELNDLSKLAVDEYPALSRSELRWVLIEALERVAPEVGVRLSGWTLSELRRRGIDVRLKTTMKSCVESEVVLSDGDSFFANTIVWTAGVKPNPTLDATNVPRGPKGHVNANARLQVIDDDGAPVAGAWAAGDNAQVPDLTVEKQPAYYPPNAQNAVRQAKLLAKNIAAELHGRPIAEYRHKSMGAVASYGVGRGAAIIMGIELKNRPAWFVDRLYHGLATPTYNRKWHIFATWLMHAFTKRNVTPMSAREHPREAFRRSIEPTRP
ncbi:NAD(P)/FAD-dependent oxidoreductase [Arthrobacter sp. A5]|uniref:NAD(P)/FAD-dependent oxidoreductase n=1 Tax=Arthrobacter sp. A5 TaxID=576926 RepID=UPI003DA8CB21